MDSLTRAFNAADSMIDLARVKAAPTSASMLASGPGGGVSTTIPSLSDARNSYLHGSKGWAFTASKAIAQRIAGTDCFVGRVSRKPRNAKDAFDKQMLPGCFKSLGSRLEPLDNHAFLTALDNPNPLQCRWQLIYSAVLSLEMCGTSFFWWDDSEQIWHLPSHWVRPADDLRSSWIIRPARTGTEYPVPGEDICFISLPDPSDPFGALSPLHSQAPAISTDEAIQTAQSQSFRNGIFPQVMIRAGKLPGMLPGEQGEVPVLSPEQRRELISAIRQRFQGASNYGEPLIVDGLIESVERLSQSPAEMDFVQSGNAVRSRILRSYGINDAIIGELENSNRAAAAVAEQNFCSNVCNPLIELISQSLTKWGRLQFSDPDLTIWLAPCTASDDELKLKQWEAAARMGYVSGNEFRRAILNLPDAPGLDGILDPLTGLPRGQSDDAA